MTYTKDQIFDALVIGLQETIGVECPVSKDAHFVHTLGLDSLDAIELVMAVEDELDLGAVMIDSDGLAAAQTVQDFVDLVYAQLNGTPTTQ